MNATVQLQSHNPAALPAARTRHAEAPPPGASVRERTPARDEFRDRLDLASRRDEHGITRPRPLDSRDPATAKGNTRPGGSRQSDDGAPADAPAGSASDPDRHEHPPGEIRPAGGVARDAETLANVDGSDVVEGWRLADDWLSSLSLGELFTEEDPQIDGPLPPAVDPAGLENDEPADALVPPVVTSMGPASLQALQDTATASTRPVEGQVTANSSHPQAPGGQVMANPAHPQAAGGQGASTTGASPAASEAHGPTTPTAPTRSAGTSPTAQAAQASPTAPGEAPLQTNTPTVARIADAVASAPGGAAETEQPGPGLRAMSPLQAHSSLGVEARQESGLTARLPAQNVEAVVSGVRTGLGAGKQQHSMSIRLDPPQLGSMRLHVQMTDGQLNATLSTSSELTQQLVQRSLTSLRTALESAGFNVDRLSVQRLAPVEAPQTSPDPSTREESGSESREQMQQHQRDQQRREALIRMWNRGHFEEKPLDVRA